MQNEFPDYKKVKVSDLIPYARNSRTHSDEQVAQIAASIKEFSFTNPVLVDGENGIIAGHGRVLAAQKLGMEEVPVIILKHLTKAQKKAYVIADNKLALNAGWDIETLRIEFEDLGAEGFDLELTGFSMDEIAALEPEQIADGLTDEDSVPEIPETPVTVLGDIWQLGKHRLMCGDSTSIDAVEKLMDGEKADICFTSPPYNVGKTPNGDEKKYLNDADNRTISDYLSLLVDFTNNMLVFSDYVFCNVQSVSGNKIALIEYQYLMREKFADTIIWDKETAEPAMARKVLNSRFEYVHVFSNDATRAIGKKDFRGTLSNVLSLNSRKGKEYAKIHKATFRVELPLYFIENFTESSVIDPFAGTGTTLIACEKTKRKSFNMELDPKYCDVIIKRWQDFTGQKAVHADTGKTFEELSNA